MKPYLEAVFVEILPDVAVYERAEQGFRAERHVERAGDAEPIGAQEPMALEATVENVEVVELHHERDARHERQRPPGQGRQEQPIAAILVLPRAAAQLGGLVDR